MIPIRRRLYQSSPGFSPRQLFAALQGAWYEPTTGTTYQESTGITPGALGSTGGLLLDRSQGLVIGPELATTTSISGVAIGGPAFTDYSTGANRVVGATYLISVTVSSYSGTGNVGVAGGTGTSWISSVTMPGNGTYVFRLTSLAVGVVQFYTRSTNTCNFSNISVRQILGNHATQATATARPTLQATPNRLVFQADDSLVTTFPSALGTDCTVARGVSGGDPVILTGQNIGTTYTLGLAEMSVTGLVIVNGPLNPVQTSRLTRYLKALG